MADTPQAGAPHVVFSTFKTAIEKLAESVVPTRLDNEVLGGMSGSSRVALLPALKFLGLMNDDRTTTTRLHSLVEAKKAGDDQWRQELRKVVLVAYQDIVSGMDLERGTAGELDKRFRDAGSEPSVAVKNARFFLHALKDAGVSVSPHMEKRMGGARRPGNGTKKKTSEGKPGKAGVKPLQKPLGGDELADEPPQGFANLPIVTKAGAFIRYPTPLSAEDYAAIRAAVDYLAVLAKN